MRHEIPAVVKRKKVRNARRKGLITGRQILTIGASIFCPSKDMRPDMQPDNSQDGAGAHEMQPESESIATTALPAYRITTLIQPIESDIDETGAYESDANETGAYVSGAYESDIDESGAYESGPYGSGAYESGAYESDQKQLSQSR